MLVQMRSARYRGGQHPRCPRPLCGVASLCAKLGEVVALIGNNTKCSRMHAECDMHGCNDRGSCS